MEEKNAAGIAKFGLKMAKVSRGLNPQALEAKVHSLLASFPAHATTKEKWLKLLNGLADAGLHFQPKFSLGALQGMITVIGEEYASPEDFSAMAKAQVTDTLRGRKKFLTLHHEAMSRSTDCGGYFRALKQVIQTAP